MTIQQTTLTASADSREPSGNSPRTTCYECGLEHSLTAQTNPERSLCTDCLNLTESQSRGSCIVCGRSIAIPTEADPDNCTCSSCEFPRENFIDISGDVVHTVIVREETEFTASEFYPKDAGIMSLYDFYENLPTISKDDKVWEVSKQLLTGNGVVAFAKETYPVPRSALTTTFTDL